MYVRGEGSEKIFKTSTCSHEAFRFFNIPWNKISCLIILISSNIKFIRYYCRIVFPFTVILLLCYTRGAHSENQRVFVLSHNRGVYVSADGVTGWKALNSGLPESFTPERIHRDSRDNLYLITRDSGIFKLGSGDRSWRCINSKDFLIRSQSRMINKYRRISAFSVCKKFPDILALATKHTLYLSRDGGNTWKEITLRGLSRNNYITSIGIRGKSPEIFIGTSFNGIFRSMGKSFVTISKGLPKEPYSKDIFFHEEISCKAFDVNNPDTIYTGLNFGGGIFRSLNGGRSWEDMKIPILRDHFNDIYDIIQRGDILFVAMGNGIYEQNKKTGRWSLSSMNELLLSLPASLSPVSVLVTSDKFNDFSLFWRLKNETFKTKSPVKSTVMDRRALYGSILAIKKNFSRLERAISKSGFNSIVIDVKDDFGNIYFSSKNETAVKIRATRNSIEIEKLLKRLKEKGIYTIARIVVFKDRNLYRAFNYRYAIWNGKYNKPWSGNPVEFWVDPHSEFVRHYNIAIAGEIAELGFDEIQFDYIRFPSDGPLYQCRYRFRKDKSIYKSEVLVDFLEQAKSELGLPISVDVYGFNAWYHFGNWIGQDIEEFAQHVDVICPMVYPSHFGRFFMRKPREQRSYSLVFTTGKRALAILGKGVVIRPYIQAFNFLSPTWGTGYLINQARASIDSGCSGFTFWNALGDYRMLERAFAQ